MIARTLCPTVLLLTGCVSMSSGVQQVGDNRYTVSAQMIYVATSTDNSSITRSKVINEATEFCKAKGYSYAEVTGEKISAGESAPAIIYFGCSK